MAKFQKKRGKATPSISTSSLPDIIFILLFFFMVATVLRDVSLKVQVRVPKATELLPVEDRNSVLYIYIGKPLPRYQGEYGTSHRMQLNDAICDDMDEIGSFIQEGKGKMTAKQQETLVVSIKSDIDAELGLITDVKQELRKAHALRVNYSSLPRAEIY